MIYHPDILANIIHFYFNRDFNLETYLGWILIPKDIHDIRKTSDPFIFAPNQSASCISTPKIRRRISHITRELKMVKIYIEKLSSLLRRYFRLQKSFIYVSAFLLPSFLLVSTTSPLLSLPILSSILSSLQVLLLM